MKSIIISIKPEQALNILNGNKTRELRKSVPKDFVGWVYGYVTKGGNTLHFDGYNHFTVSPKTKRIKRHPIVNGTIPFRFWFDEYDKYNPFYFENTGIKELNYLVDGEQRDKMCLEDDEITQYGKGKDLYAWHINKLEVFDKPMILMQFHEHDVLYRCGEYKRQREDEETYWCWEEHRIDKAPQSWQYVWVAK
jgi:predicted transcriptional regulator